MLVGNGQARPMLQDALGNDDRVLMLPVQSRENLPAPLAAVDVGLAPRDMVAAGTSVPIRSESWLLPVRSSQAST